MAQIKKVVSGMPTRARSVNVTIRQGNVLRSLLREFCIIDARSKRKRINGTGVFPRMKGKGSLACCKTTAEEDGSQQETTSGGRGGMKAQRTHSADFVSNHEADRKGCG